MEIGLARGSRSFTTNGKILPRKTREEKQKKNLRSVISGREEPNKTGGRKLRLAEAQELLKEHNCEFDYAEEDGLGSIDLIYRGVSYHIWEPADEQEEGVETNLHNAGRSEDLTGSDYEEKLLELLKWRLAS